MNGTKRMFNNKAFKTLVENEIGVKIKCLKLDNVNTSAKWNC